MQPRSKVWAMFTWVSSTESLASSTSMVTKWSSSE